MDLPKVSLAYREGGSDKVYEVSVEPSGAGFVVNFAYGRRGSALKTGTKTLAPVTIEAAVKCYEGIVREKVGKGYSPGETGTPFAGTELAGRAAGITCQLLTPAPLDIEAYIGEAEWCGMEKYDGERRLIRIDPQGDVIGINRRGLTVPLPAPVAAEARRVADRFPITDHLVLDGELLGNVWVGFDVAAGAVDGIPARIEDLPFAERHKVLQRAFPMNDNLAGQVSIAGVHFEAAGKANLVADVRNRGGEGVVFKRANAPYRSGRSDDALKVKFIETASVIAGPSKGTKRSVAMVVLDAAGGRVDCGNVTIPSNFEIPTEETVVEVSYLYAYRESGKLYQPVYRGPRGDISVDECLQAQFKYRPTAD